MDEIHDGLPALRKSRPHFLSLYLTPDAGSKSEKPDEADAIALRGQLLKVLEGNLRKLLNADKTTRKEVRMWLGTSIASLDLDNWIKQRHFLPFLKHKQHSK